MGDGMPFAHMFLLILLVIPLAVCWALALVDLMRRIDLSGWATALWLLVIVLIPFFGALIYFAFRPERQRARKKPQSSDFYRKFHLEVHPEKHPSHGRRG